MRVDLPAPFGRDRARNLYATSRVNVESVARGLGKPRRRDKGPKQLLRVRVGSSDRFHLNRPIAFAHRPRLAAPPENDCATFRTRSARRRCTNRRSRPPPMFNSHIENTIRRRGA